MLFDLRCKKDVTYAIGLFILLCIPAILSYNSKTELQAIRETGVLKMVTRNSAGTYFIEKGQPAGFEYDLGTAFAEYIGVDLEVVIVPTLGDIFSVLKHRNAHIAGANLTITPQREEQFSFSPPYMHTVSSLIYRITQGKQPPAEITELVGGAVAVPKNSSHAEVLQSLQTAYPDLSWEEVEGLSPTDLLERVHEREIDFTVMDSVTFDSHSSYFPGVNKSLSLTEPMPIAWMYSPHPDDSLKRALARFFALDSTRALIDKLKNKYFNRTNKLNFFDTVSFRKHMETRLPALMPHFLEAQKETGIDWKMLAAVAYQESHWNPKAVSPTGVKGVMMLTHAAAAEVGVKDRTNARESILGGARYLLKSIKKIPKRVVDKDRTWFGLASYNVGFGHLEDARILSERAGQSPNHWNVVREFLPLLTKPKYFNTVKRGYARGYEPVHYVKNIRRYMDLIHWENRITEIRKAKKEPEEFSLGAETIPLPINKMPLSL